MRYERDFHGRDEASSEAGKDLAYGLGVFSLVLGAAEVFMPRTLARTLGMSGSERLIQAYGVREIITGVGILASDNPRPWIMGRIGGDALDLATLAAGYKDDNPRRDNVGIAMGAVAGVTALDVVCAGMLSSTQEEPSPRSMNYRYRSGFPAPVEQMRGAASDFEVPRDYRTPEALRPYTERAGGRGLNEPMSASLQATADA